MLPALFTLSGPSELDVTAVACALQPTMKVVNVAPDQWLRPEYKHRPICPLLMLKLKLLLLLLLKLILFLLIVMLLFL